MADQQHRAGVAAEVIFEPQARFQVEVIGRLVEQQQIGLDEQERGERDAHAPAAGELAARAGLRSLVEP